MDETLKANEEMDTIPEKGTNLSKQQDHEAMEESTADTQIASPKSENVEEDQDEEQPPDSMTKILTCTACGFVAKSERSLKIHSVKKHRKVSEEMDPTLDIDAVSKAELLPQKKSRLGVDQGEPVVILKKCDMASNKLTHQEEAGTPERRISKRTPKPKVFHSCNYCGQEFRDKAPLDVHVQRYHSKDTQLTFDTDEDMKEDEDETEDSASTVGVPTKVASKRPHSSFQLKCDNCEVTVSSLALLENHVQVHHPDIDWHRCKLCNFFTATAGWMQRHLSSESHKLQLNKDPQPKFEECVERVSRSSAGEGVLMSHGASPDVTHANAMSEKDVDSEEALNAGLVEKDELENEPPKKKQGRPKHESNNTCEFCGLVVSTAANLSVHVRRKHSKQYAYTCNLCSYNCVTKGDMDRHCVTRKHLKRTEINQRSNVNPASKQHAFISVPAATASPVHEANAVITTVKDEQKSEGSESKQQSGVEQTSSDTNQQMFEFESAHPCSQCEFVAQTMASLDLHVKRKHTNEFEYVCLACSYYAVTSRDMVRHANTEKHKQKRDVYMDTQEGKNSRAIQLPTKPDKLQTDSLVSEGEVKGDADANQEEDGQQISSPSGPIEIGRHGSSVSDDADDDNTGEIITVTVGAEPDSHPETSWPDESESTQNPTEDQIVSTPEQQNQKEQEKDPVVQLVKASVKHMTSAPPFDACIVSAKSLSEKQAEEMPQDMTLQSKTTVHFPGESTSSFGHNYPHVKKLNPKEAEARGDGASSSTRIRCEDCGFMADGINGLNVHISMKHASKEKHFHCLVCGKSFYTENNLHQHLNSAAHLRIEKNCVEELPDGGANFKCMKCTARLDSEQDLFLHIKEKHVELLREVNKYVLEDTELINREREENQGSVCKYCGKVCKSSNSMAFLAHIRTHTGSKPFMCKICNFASAQLGDARNHVKRHLGMREYKCDICGWAFVMKKHLSTHMLGKHGIGQPKERKFECDLCDRLFSEKWALNNHMKLHSGEKPYKCPWPSCYYSFLNQSAMKDHHRTHTGEKSYLCDLCGFAGGTKHALTKHRRQHTGERPFKCTLCKFASTTQSHLSRHKRVHTGEKPYRCPWCDYRSNCAENIRKHILHTGKHEGVKMYNCPKCVFATNSPVEFRNHLKESHPDIENPDLAYLHAGIVSKAFDCRLRGQGASFVETETLTSPPRPPTSAQEDSIQQVIIIQGYEEGEVAQTLEESAAATLQTLAMAGQVAEVLHITEDGHVITSGAEVPAAAAAHLAGTSAEYVVLDSQDAQEKLKGLTRRATAGQSHPPTESSTALDALLNAVSEIGHQEEVREEEEVIPEILTPEVEVSTQKELQPKVMKAKEAAPESSQEDIQEVLKLAASQMMKDGLTQVIVNDKGTHYIVTELQLEEGVFREAAVGDGGQPQVEQQETEEMVVYLQG
ncbi:zinc finger protein 407 [Synchiropus picturatus]